MKKAVTYRVCYGILGNKPITIEFIDPQEDGILAEQKARDYYQSAVESFAFEQAHCTVSRDGIPWLDSDKPD